MYDVEVQDGKSHSIRRRPLLLPAGFDNSIVAEFPPCNNVVLDTTSEHLLHRSVIFPFSRDNVSSILFDFGPFQHHHHPIIRAAQTQETSNDRHSPLAIKSSRHQGPRTRRAWPLLLEETSGRRHLSLRLIYWKPHTHRSLSHLHMCARQSRQRQATAAG